jgi:hypothetical protein
VKIVVHVDRLVLDGLGTEPRHAARVQAAVEREVARLLGGAPRGAFGGGAVPHVRAPELRYAPGDSPERTGAGIAASVHDGIRRGAR